MIIIHITDSTCPSCIACSYACTVVANVGNCLCAIIIGNYECKFVCVSAVITFFKVRDVGRVMRSAVLTVVLEDDLCGVVGQVGIF